MKFSLTILLVILAYVSADVTPHENATGTAVPRYTLYKNHTYREKWEPIARDMGNSTQELLQVIKE